MISFFFLYLGYIQADSGLFILLFFVVLGWLIYKSNDSSGSSSSVFSSDSVFSGDKFRSEIKLINHIKGELSLDIKGKINGNDPKMNPYSTSLSLKTFLFDKEFDEPFYTLNGSLKDNLSESFMTQIGLGQVRYDQFLNLTKWVNIASFSKADLIHPRRGNRTVIAKSFLVDNNKYPIIVAGQPYTYLGIIKTIESSLKLEFDSPGYYDEIEHNEEILCSMVDLAVSVAKSDSNFDKSEGEVIKNWMTDVYKNSLDDDKNDIKKALNEQFKKSFNGSTNLDKSILSFNDIAGVSQKFNAIDLCVKVLTADGKEDEEETNMIEKIVSDLGLDHKEYLKRKEKLLLKSNVTVSGGCTEASLGIDSNWTNSKKLKFVKTEFIKWNGRLNTLREGAQRESAQNKLNCLAELKLKYEGK